MREDIAGNAFLCLEVGDVGSLWAVLDERFLGICGFTMNEAHKLMR
jgi:hypothetical protein